MRVKKLDSRVLMRARMRKSIQNCLDQFLIHFTNFLKNYSWAHVGYVIKWRQNHDYDYHAILITKKNCSQKKEVKMNIFTYDTIESI
jgi:hypothetical protein